MSYVKSVPLKKLFQYTQDDDEVVLLASTNEQPEDAAQLADAIGVEAIDNASVNAAIEEDAVETVSVLGESKNFLLHGYRIALDNKAKPSVLLLGDSMIGTASSQLYGSLRSELGISGIGLLSAGPSGGATESLVDNSKWISAITYSLPSGGEISFADGGVNFFEGDTLKVYYIIQPDGGTFKVQSQKEGGAWTDEAGYTSVDTNGTLAGGVISISKSDYRAKWKIKVVGLTGTCTVIGAGIRNSKSEGALITVMNNGSNSYNNLTQCLNTPQSILEPIMADLAPNLIILSHLDGASVVNASQATYQDRISNAAINSSSGGVAFTVSGDLLSFGSTPIDDRDLIVLRSDGTLPAPLQPDTDYIAEKAGTNQFYVIDRATMTRITLTDAGTGTHYGKIAYRPSWLIVGPPVGDTEARDTANKAQIVAQRDLAHSRGDGFFDNRSWALPIDRANSMGLVYEVHYTNRAAKQWVPLMMHAFGISKSSIAVGSRSTIPIPAATNHPYGVFARVDPNTYGTSTPSLELLGNIRVAKNPYTGLSGVIYFEDTAGATGSIDRAGIYYSSNRLHLQTQAAYNFSFDGGYDFRSETATTSAPAGRLGHVNYPWDSLIMGKTIKTTASTGAQTINKTCGSVVFDIGETSLVVTNNKVLTPNSGGNEITGSVIVATVRNDDATMKSVIVEVTSNGSFTLIPNAAPTAKTRVDWVIFAP